MSRNTNNSKNRALNNDIAENDNRNASDVAGVSDTLPQPAPAPNIQGTAAADEGHVSQREFNDLRNEVNDFRDEMRANSNRMETKLDEAIKAMTNAIASQQAQLSRSNDDLARRVETLSNDHTQLRADVTRFMNNPAVDITAPVYQPLQHISSIQSYF